MARLDRPEACLVWSQGDALRAVGPGLTANWSRAISGWMCPCRRFFRRSRTRMARPGTRVRPGAAHPAAGTVGDAVQFHLLIPETDRADRADQPRIAARLRRPGGRRAPLVPGTDATGAGNGGAIAGMPARLPRAASLRGGAAGGLQRSIPGPDRVDAHATRRARPEANPRRGRESGQLHPPFRLRAEGGVPDRRVGGTGSCGNSTSRAVHACHTNGCAISPSPTSGPAGVTRSSFFSIGSARTRRRCPSVKPRARRKSG